VYPPAALVTVAALVVEAGIVVAVVTVVTGLVVAAAVLCATVAVTVRVVVTVLPQPASAIPATVRTVARPASIAASPTAGRLTPASHQRHANRPARRIPAFGARGLRGHVEDVVAPNVPGTVHLAEAAPRSL
jgi:hypothetical protein